MALLVMLILLTIASVGAASDASDDAVLLDLAQWLRAHPSPSAMGTLGTSPTLPRIVRVEPIELATFAYGADYVSAVGNRFPLIHGLYDFENSTIYLSKALNLATDQGRAVLLHELVHHLQYASGQDRQVRCMNELESLAYDLEARYRVEHHAPVEFTSAEVRQLSRCSLPG